MHTIIEQAAVITALANENAQLKQVLEQALAKANALQTQLDAEHSGNAEEGAAE